MNELITKTFYFKVAMNTFRTVERTLQGDEITVMTFVLFSMQIADGDFCLDQRQSQWLHFYG